MLGRPFSSRTCSDKQRCASWRTQNVRNTATALRFKRIHARAQLPELTETRFEGWARQESFGLAKEHAYRNGHLQGSTDPQNGDVLPADYVATVKPLAEHRIVFAGYRLADVLTQNASPLPTPTPAEIPPASASESIVRENMRSKVYHLGDCPGFDTMSAANMITFASEVKAQQAGYRKAKNCP